jgi:hypothetical protein
MERRSLSGDVFGRFVTNPRASAPNLKEKATDHIGDTAAGASPKLRPCRIEVSAMAVKLRSAIAGH